MFFKLCMCMIIRYLSHKLTVYHSHISWEKNTQFHMTCHIYQHMWLVIHVSFPEHCWRGFCWLPKGYDCGGMNPCCVVFTPNQLNIITFHFSGLNLLYLACITNDRKARANRDILFFNFHSGTWTMTMKDQNCYSDGTVMTARSSVPNVVELYLYSWHH